MKARALLIKRLANMGVLAKIREELETKQHVFVAVAGEQEGRGRRFEEEAAEERASQVEQAHAGPGGGLSYSFAIRFPGPFGCYASGWRSSKA